MSSQQTLSLLNATLREIGALRPDLARLGVRDPFEETDLWPEMPTPHDRLVIALYGATNAGKSTLVEAVIGGDGTAIGDGRKDFTDQVREVSAGPLLVRDLPGTAGREGKLLKEIAGGLRGAHVALLVLGDRLPDEDLWSQLFAHTRHVPWVGCVLNSRLPAPLVRQPPETTIAQRRELEEEVKRRMTVLFGHRFRGVWEVHAQLAHLSRARELDGRFERKKAIFMEKFSSAEEAFQRAGLQVLLDELLQAARADTGDQSWPQRWAVLARCAVLTGALHSLLPALRHHLRVAEGQADAARSRAKQLLTHSRALVESEVARWGDAAAEEMLATQQGAAAQRLGARALASRIDALNKRRSAEVRATVQQVLDTQSAQLELALQRSVRRAGLQIHLSAPPELGMTLEATETSLWERGGLSLLAEGISWLFKGTFGGWGIIAGAAQFLWSHTHMAKERRARALRHEAHQQVERWRERSVREVWAAAQAPLRQMEADVQATLNALDDETRARGGLVALVERLLRRFQLIGIAALVSKEGPLDLSTYLLPLAANPGQLPCALLHLGGPSPHPARRPVPVLSAAQARALGLGVPASAEQRALLAELGTILQDR